MFPNLSAEMARRKMTIKEMAKLTGINYETLKLKIRGVTEFKLGEMVAIKKNVFPEREIDYLFSTEITTDTEQDPT